MGMNQKTKAKRKTEKVEQKQKLHKFTQDYPSERKDYKPVQGDPLNNGKVSIEMQNQLSQPTFQMLLEQDAARVKGLHG